MYICTKERVNWRHIAYFICYHHYKHIQHFDRNASYAYVRQALRYMIVRYTASCMDKSGYLSREIVIPESTLYSWASGKRVIPHASREHLARMIGCAAEELAPTRFAVQWESMTPFQEKRDR